LFLAERGQGWQGSKMQDYWLVVRVLLTPPAEAAASQKWKIIYLQVLTTGKEIRFRFGSSEDQASVCGRSEISYKFSVKIRRKK
jgi:hypothetical protein